MDLGGLHQGAPNLFNLHLHDEEGRRMNKNLVILQKLQSCMSDILDNMDKDEFYSAPTWTFERIWFMLEEVKKGLE